MKIEESDSNSSCNLSDREREVAPKKINLTLVSNVDKKKKRNKVNAKTSGYFSVNFF